MDFHIKQTLAYTLLNKSLEPAQISYHKNMGNPSIYAKPVWWYEDRSSVEYMGRSALNESGKGLGVNGWLAKGVSPLLHDDL